MSSKIFEIGVTLSKLSARIVTEGSSFDSDLMEDLVNRMRSMNFEDAPPAVSEFFFKLFAPGTRVDAMLGDLEEKFESNVREFGVRRARWRYRAEVWRSLGPLLLGKLKNWGLFALLLELGRRKIGL